MLKINIVVENEIEYICFKTNKKYIKFNYSRK